jgi:hypothetical protein
MLLKWKSALRKVCSVLSSSVAGTALEGLQLLAGMWRQRPRSQELPNEYWVLTSAVEPGNEFPV